MGNMPDERKEKVTKVVIAATNTGKKGLEFASNVLASTASGSKTVAGNIVKSAKQMSEKAKESSEIKRLKKLNPLFPDEYWSEEFFIPNIICIVDDAVRRDVDGCQGAIGWRENKKGTEVLFLYDEFVAECGLKFVPTAICDEMYYVDSFDKKRFIKVDCIFRQAHEEKIAELENIAYSLGAKSCSIEIEQKEMQKDKKNRNVSIAESSSVVGKEGYMAEAMSDNSLSVSGKSETKFKGNDTVTRPNLKWFAYDDNIKNLIEYRCNGNNEITSKRLELYGASSSTMSRKAAYSIDLTMAAMKMNQSASIEELSVKESTSKIIFCLEF